MGRQERKRKERQRARQTELLPDNREHLALIWEGYLRTCTKDIWKAARYGKGVAFHIIKEAQRELAEYGEETVAKTKEFLENEACKALASVIDPRLYHQNQRLDKRDEAPPKRQHHQ